MKGSGDSMARVTLQTIADRVGVSRMTVSNAFARPDQLSVALRDEILKVAADLGYVGPDPTARALSSGRAGAVGILLTDTLGPALTDEVAMSFLGSIAEELAPTGLALTLLSAAAHGGVIQARDVPIDGAIVYSCDYESSAVDWLVRRGLPMVFVDQPPAPGVPSVNIDDKGGAFAAAHHLVGLGHRRIGIVTAGAGGTHGLVPDPRAEGYAFSEQQRIQGWMDALDAADIVPTMVRQPYGSPQDGGERSVAALLEADVTAVLCLTDVMAAGVIRGIHDAGSVCRRTSPWWASTTTRWLAAWTRR